MKGGGHHEHLIQNNLEMYRILKGTQYKSPVPTKNVYLTVVVEVEKM